MQTGEEIRLGEQSGIYLLDSESNKVPLSFSQASTGITSSNEITYSERFPGIEESFIVTGYGVKYDYILLQPLSIDSQTGEFIALCEKI